MSPTTTLSHLPLPPEIWSQVLVVASSSLGDMARLSTVNRIARETCWHPPSCKASLIVKLYGVESALKNLERYGYLSDALDVLKCLVSGTFDGGKVSRDCGSTHQDGRDCPLFWVLFRSNTATFAQSAFRLSAEPLQTSSRSRRFRHKNPKDCHHNGATSHLDHRPKLSLTPAERFAIAKFLIHHANLNPSHHAESLLMPAARAESPSILQFLADNATFTPSQLCQPLRHAVQFQRPSQVKILVSLGAVTKSWIARHGHDALCHAIQNADLETCRLLLERGVEATDSALAQAASQGLESMVEVLIEYGAAITPLCIHFAAKARNLRILQALANSKPPAIFPGAHTLEWVVGLNDLEMVKVVLEMGISGYGLQVGKGHWDAFSIAVVDGNVEAVKLLVEAGLRPPPCALERARKVAKDEILNILVHAMGSASASNLRAASMQVQAQAQAVQAVQR
ncbi:hypothetical protein HDU97_006776 [Phlyctochytrium planicorne]|nr:hypothetical protein HDU97_006776 [Phlyctochytrium planicorne]